MKTTIITEEDRIQLCLHPETKYDESVLDILEKMPNTHRTHLYKRQGGYTAFDNTWDTYGNQNTGEDLLIVFDQPSPPTNKGEI